MSKRTSPKGMREFAREIILQVRANPPEPDNLRHVLWYSNIGKIVRWLEAQDIDQNQYDRTHKKPFSVAFYATLSSVLSGMVLSGELTYAELNIIEEARFKDEADVPDHKVGLLFEKEGLANTFKPFKTGLNISLWSCKGFQSTNVLEQIANRLRRDPLKILFVFSDFDPSGIEIAADLGRRAKQLGIKTRVVRIGINPEDIPEERRALNSLPIKEKDSRSEKFIRENGNQGFEVEALSTRERRELVLRRMMEHGVDVAVSVEKRLKENQVYISRYVTEQLLFSLKRSVRRSALQRIRAYDTRQPTTQELIDSILDATEFLQEPQELIERIAREVKAEFGISDSDLEDEQ